MASDISSGEEPLARPKGPGAPPPEVRAALDWLAHLRAVNRAGDFRLSIDRRQRPPLEKVRPLVVSDKRARELLSRRHGDENYGARLDNDVIEKFRRVHEVFLVRLVTGELLIGDKWRPTGFMDLPVPQLRVVAAAIAGDLAFFFGFNEDLKVDLMLRFPVLLLSARAAKQLLDSAPQPIENVDIWKALILKGNLSVSGLVELVGESRLKDLGLSDFSVDRLIWRHHELAVRILRSVDPEGDLTEALRLPELHEIVQYESEAADAWLAKVRLAARDGGFLPGSPPEASESGAQEAFDRAYATHLYRLQHGVFVIATGSGKGDVRRGAVTYGDLPGVQRQMVEQRLKDDLAVFARWRPDAEERGLESVAVLNADPSEIDSVVAESGRTPGEVWSALTLGFQDPAEALRNFADQFAAIAAVVRAHGSDVTETRQQLAATFSMPERELERILCANRASLSERAQEVESREGDATSDETTILIATLDAMLQESRGAEPDGGRDEDDGTGEPGGGARRGPDDGGDRGGPVPPVVDSPDRDDIVTSQPGSGDVFEHDQPSAPQAAVKSSAPIPAKGKPVRASPMGRSARHRQADEPSGPATPGNTRVGRSHREPAASTHAGQRSNGATRVPARHSRIRPGSAPDALPAPSTLDGAGDLVAQQRAGGTEDPPVPAPPASPGVIPADEVRPGPRAPALNGAAEPVTQLGI